MADDSDHSELSAAAGLDDPVYADRVAEVQRLHADEGPDVDLAQRVIDEWSDLLGCPARDVVTVLRIADLTRFCVVRGLDPPVSPDDYDTTDDLTLLATAIGQQRARGAVQPVLRMAGLAAIDRLEQLAPPTDEVWRRDLDRLRAELMQA